MDLQKGIDLLNQRDFTGAEVFFRKLTSAKPRNGRAKYFLGESLRKLGRTDEALVQFKLARQLGEAHERLWLAEGLAYKATAQPEAAHHCFKEALRVKPDFVDAVANLANLHLEAGDHQNAVTFYEMALRLEPGRVEILENLGRLYREIKRHEQASLCFAALVKRQPDSPRSLLELAMSLHDLSRHDEADPYFDRAALLAPKDERILHNRGMNSLARGDYPKAIASLQACVDLYPAAPFAHFHLAVALRAAHRYEESRAALDAAEHLISARPELDLENVASSVRRERGFLMIEIGAQDNGWEHYEARIDQLRAPGFEPYDEHCWRGEDLTGKHLWIIREQGIGDEIWFAGMYKDVIAKAREVTLYCGDRLQSAFERSFPSTRVVGVPERPDAWKAPLREIGPQDLCILAGSLGRYLRPTRGDFPIPQPYLVPNASKVEVWREKLAALGEGPKIGLSWRGGTPLTSGTLRSIPLDAFKNVIPLTGAHYVSLQYFSCAAEIQEFVASGGPFIHDWKTLLDDYEETIALVAALDLVVTVQTAVVHTASALGTRTLLLLPQALSSWRWMSEDHRTPWYRDLEILRQSQAGDWSSVMTQLRERLADFVTARA